MVNDLIPCVLLESCESHVLTQTTTTTKSPQHTHTHTHTSNHSNQTVTSFYGTCSCSSLSLHHLSAVMDDEDDRHLLDILG